jgi:hypothetical protein
MEYGAGVSSSHDLEESDRLWQVKLFGIIKQADSGTGRTLLGEPGQRRGPRNA